MKKLKILNKNWTVKFGDIELDYKKDEWNYSQVRAKEQEILINKNCKRETYISSFLHEVCHVMFYTDYGSKNSMKNLIDVELACNLIGDGFSQLIRTKQFKDIIKWLS